MGWRVDTGLSNNGYYNTVVGTVDIGATSINGYYDTVVCKVETSAASINGHKIATA